MFPARGNGGGLGKENPQEVVRVTVVTGPAQHGGLMLALVGFVQVGTPFVGDDLHVQRRLSPAEPA